MAERVIKTFKDMIAARVTGLDLDKEKWIDLLPQVRDQYNKQVHSTIKMTPKDAQLAVNREKVLSNTRKKHHLIESMSQHK